MAMYVSTGRKPPRERRHTVAKFYKAEFEGKIIVRSSANREFPYAVIFGNHWITSGYASFCGSAATAQKTYDDYTKKYFDTYFTIVSTTEISEAEFKTIKAKLDAIKKQLVEAN
jgi:hypothetical protein